MDSEGGKAPGQVGKELNKLGESTTSLIECVKDLEGRLTSVLLDPPIATKETENPQPEEAKVPTAMQVATCNYRVQEATRSIASLMDRLEL